MIHSVREEYFEWMYHIACDGRYAKKDYYRKLLTYLHDTKFTWVMDMDSNRAEDGKDLRWRFAYDNYYEDRHAVSDDLDGPCSVLEMILALAIRLEESLLDDPSFGDRTAQWFWKMISSLGLGSMNDDLFDIGYVEEVIYLFLNRKYEPDGHGGLFILRDCEYDLRDVEIWVQAMWYIDSIM